MNSDTYRFSDTLVLDNQTWPWKQKFSMLSQDHVDLSSHENASCNIVRTTRSVAYLEHIKLAPLASTETPNFTKVNNDPETKHLSNYLWDVLLTTSWCVCVRACICGFGFFNFHRWLFVPWTLLFCQTWATHHGWRRPTRLRSRVQILFLDYPLLLNTAYAFIELLTTELTILGLSQKTNKLVEMMCL